MVTAHECDDTVATALNLIDEVLTEKALRRPRSRPEVMEVFLRYFPEYEAEITNYFAALNRETEDSEVLAARLRREYLESRWV